MLLLETYKAILKRKKLWAKISLKWKVSRQICTLTLFLFKEFYKNPVNRMNEIFYSKSLAPKTELVPGVHLQVWYLIPNTATKPSTCPKIWLNSWVMPREITEAKDRFDSLNNTWQQVGIGPRIANDGAWVPILVPLGLTCYAHKLSHLQPQFSKADTID